MKEFKIVCKKTTQKKVAGKTVAVSSETTKTIFAKTAAEAEAKAKRFAGWTGLKVVDIQEAGLCMGL